MRERSRTGSPLIPFVKGTLRHSAYWTYCPLPGSAREEYPFLSPNPEVGDRALDITDAQYTPLLETMVDSTGAGRGPKPCSHTKIDYSGCSPLSHTWSTEGPLAITGPWPELVGYTATDSGHLEWMSPLTLPLWGGPGFRLANIDFSDLLATHLISCKTLVDESVPLGVFVAEIKDITRLIHSAKMIFRHIDDLLWLTYDGTMPHKSLRAKSLDDLALAYSFGLRPLISDLIGIYTSLGKIRNQAKRLIKACQTGKLTVKNRKTFELLPPDSVLGLEYPDAPPSGPHGYFSHVYRYARLPLAEAYITSKVDPNIGWMNPFLATLYSAIRVFGLDSPVKIYWNLIPYSFCVDWVVNISKMLDHLSVAGLLNSPISLETSTHLEWLHIIERKTYVYESPEASIPLTSGIDGPIKIVDYERVVGLPRGDVFTLKTPSTRELMLSWFLLHQRHSYSGSEWKSCRKDFRRLSRWYSSLHGKWVEE